MLMIMGYLTSIFPYSSCNLCKLVNLFAYLHPIRSNHGGRHKKKQGSNIIIDILRILAVGVQDPVGDNVCISLQTF